MKVEITPEPDIIEIENVKAVFKMKLRNHFCWVLTDYVPENRPEHSPFNGERLSYVVQILKQEGEYKED